MEKFALAIRKFARDEEGVTIIEYALMAALIAVGVAVAVLSIRTELNTLFGKIAACVKNPATCVAP
jgi:pilus assembly protein Flp/PilA